jgi:hypothetical protein
MAHPFDVDKVKTGQDLIDYINDAVLRLQNQEISGSLKWDGINTSFKLITNDAGGKEFRMDRGTSHIDSVVGLDAKAALTKWGPEHGMANAVATLLKIFNAAIPQITGELKELGMWEDPTKYFNTEYIEGKSNVQEYGENILAIHGINQFYEKKAQSHAIRKGTSMDRPGFPRPTDPLTGKPTKSGGIEVPYNKDALASLIEKVQPIARKQGFEIYGDVPVEFDPEIVLDLEEVLNTSVSVQITPDGVATNTLREWLQMAEHPQDRKVTRADGKSVGALSKDIYMAVLQSADENGIPLSQYLESQEDVKDAINGGIFYHGTRLLGQAVKNSLRSVAGPVGSHEGVVLRGMEDFLVKLTGDFIVQGLASTHGKQEEMLKESPLYWARNLTYSESVVTEQTDVGKRAITIYPGRFQPMGRHHFQTYQELASKNGIENTFVATSNNMGLNSPLSFEQKKSIMEAHGVPSSQIVEVKNPYYAKEIYESLGGPEEVEVKYFVGDKDMKENPRFQKTSGTTKEGYDWSIGVLPHVEIDVPGIGEMSGTTLRTALKHATREDFETLMGWFDEEIYEMLQGSLKEIAAMSHGSAVVSVQRAPDVAGSEKKKKCHEKNFLPKEQLVNEVMDYLLGISVG